MKKIIFAFAILLAGLPLFAQTYFMQPNQMNNGSGYASAAEKADINNDGYVDLLVSGGYSNMLLWYKNNGDGTFDEIQIDTIDNGKYITSGDIDGDGYIDVIATSGDNDYVAWYKNIDGLGNFAGGQIIITDVTIPRIVKYADIDGDGLKDIIVNSNNSGVEIVWYKNLGGGNFGSKNFISNINLSDFVIADIDGDGDNDIVASLYLGNNIIWFENTDGAGTFSSDILISDAVNRSEAVFVADIDGDSDPDVLSASSNDDKIAWYPNTDGAGTFGSQRIITLHADGAKGVYAADLDNDGDMDVLSASKNDSLVAWYENLGSGNFDTTQQYILSNIFYEPRFVIAGDVDNDGDNDVFSVAYWHRDVDWYENKTLGIISQPDDANGCIADSTLFTVIGKDYDSLQWQVNNGSGFEDITDNSLYSGSNNDTLFVTGIDASMNGNIYRCKLINLAGNMFSDNATLNVIEDNVPPTIVCMTNQTRQADSSHSYTAVGNEFDPFSVTDNCNIQSFVNNYNNDSTLANTSFPEGTTTVTWLATDYSGNISTCSFDITVNEYTQIDEIDLSRITITPNPVHNNLELKITEKQLSGKIQIVDVTGKVIKQIENNKIKQSIDVSDLQKGIYFIKINNIVTKFIKE